MEARKIKKATSHGNIEDIVNKSLVKDFEKEIKMAHEKCNPRLKNPKNNRRLNSRQYKSLMNKIKEIGINNDKHEIIDLDTYKAPSIPELIDLSLNVLTYHGRDDVRQKYNKIVKGKKFTDANKLSILSYLFNSMVGVLKKVDRNIGVWTREISKLVVDPNEKIPFCLLPEKMKTKEARNRKIGLKTKGDIKVRPLRFMPDEEYLKEMQHKRTKFDSFDKISDDKKILWSRYVEMVLGSENIEKGYNEWKTDDPETISFAMKYACKMVGIKEFSGNFCRPYWILYRANKFKGQKTKKEQEIFDRITMKSIGVKSNEKTIPIIDSTYAIKLVVPVLKEMGVYEEYQKKTGSLSEKDSYRRFRIAAELFQKATES